MIFSDNVDSVQNGCRSRENNNLHGMGQFNHQSLKPNFLPPRLSYSRLTVLSFLATTDCTDLGHVFPSVLLELLLKSVHLSHHFLRVLPAEVLLLQLDHDQERRRHQVDPRWRLR